MPVSEVKALYSEGGQGEDLVWTYTAVYEVITTSASDGPNTVLSGAGLPLYGSPYAFGGDTNLWAWARSRRATLMSRKESRTVWNVTIEYSSKGSDRDPQDETQQDPTAWQWKVSGSFGMSRRAPEKDIEGRALQNLAEEPFLPPPEVDDPHIILVLEKNTETISLDLYADAGGKVNSADIWGLPARCAKLNQWTFQFAWTGSNQAYVVNRFEVEVKLDGFYFKPLNAGFREKGEVNVVDGVLNMRGARDEFWLPLARPRLLDVNGKFLPDGSTPLFFDQPALPLKYFKLEDEFDFSQIFPATLPGPFV